MVTPLLHQATPVMFTPGSLCFRNATLHGLVEVIALLHASHWNHGWYLTTSVASRYRNHAIVHHHVASPQLPDTQPL